MVLDLVELVSRKQYDVEGGAEKAIARGSANQPVSSGSLAGGKADQSEDWAGGPAAQPGRDKDRERFASAPKVLGVLLPHFGISSGCKCLVVPHRASSNCAVREMQR